MASACLGLLVAGWCVPVPGMAADAVETWPRTSGSGCGTEPVEPFTSGEWSRAHGAGDGLVLVTSLRAQVTSVWLLGGVRPLPEAAARRLRRWCAPGSGVVPCHHGGDVFFALECPGVGWLLSSQLRTSESFKWCGQWTELAASLRARSRPRGPQSVAR